MPVPFNDRFGDNTKPHDQFQTEVIEYLESKNYLIEKQAYHDRFTKEMIDLLRYNCEDITTLYKRTLADRLCVSKDGERNKVFDLEIKTSNNASRIEGEKNLVVEALALAFHIYLSRIGVKCLYAWRDTSNGVEKGFWATDFNLIFPEGENPRLIEAVHFSPARTDETQVRWVINTIFGPKIRYNNRASKTKGSDDPYVRIMQDNLKYLKHWKDLIP